MNNGININNDDDAFKKIEIPKFNNDFEEIDISQDEGNINQKNDEPAQINNKHNLIVEDLSRPWNYRVMLLLKKIGEKSIGYRWMHEVETQKNEHNFKICSLLEIIILAIMGTLTSLEFGLFATNSGLIQNKWGLITITLVQLIIIFLYCIVKGYKDYKDFRQKIFEHRLIKTQFYSLYSDIENQFAKPVEKRRDADDFLDDKTKEYNDLLFTAPEISKRTLNQYIKETENNEIYKPLLVGQFDTIEIVVDGKDDNVSLNVKHQDSKSDDNKYKYQFERYINNF